MQEADEIRAAQQGSPQAFKNLIERYKVMAFAIANKVAGELYAEDITQDAFIQVFLAIRHFRNESGFSTWLYRIVYNESLKFLKTEDRRKKAERIIERMETGDVPQSNSDAIITNALTSLNSSEYIVVSLFYLEGKSIKEIQTVTSFSAANIKVLLHRARGKMAEVLKSQNRIDYG